ncbi:hypothetical protein K502DRAFT_324367, partial [Neoconidiobolus thromboides FSU 785]
MRLAIEPFQGNDKNAQMGVSNPSNLRLRAQYLFNVFEEVGNDEDVIFLLLNNKWLIDCI